MLSVVLVVAGFALCSADIPTIGPCDVNVKTESNFDFVKFHTENGGHWEGVLGPNTHFNKKLESFVINITSAGEDKFRDLIYYRTTDGKSGLLADEIITNDGNGVNTATTTDGDVYKVKFLKYRKGKYAFYYICSSEGSDKKTDYRYVLAHGPLTKEEKSQIYSIDKKYGFKGKLISIGGRHHHD